MTALLLAKWLGDFRDRRLRKRGNALLGGLQRRRIKVQRELMLAMRTALRKLLETKVKQLVAFLQVAQMASFNLSLHFPEPAAALLAQL